MRKEILIKFIIKGLTCDACIRLAKARIERIPQVKSVNISDLDGNTQILSDQKLSLDQIRHVLLDTDYQIIEIN